MPFLASHKTPFDSDEAVEGLMALHVLQGEFPAFFWGQAFKGVPEVYASALAFSMFGASVTTLKAVTLVFFAIYVGLNYILISRLASAWPAAAVSLLLIVSPPTLVFWTLDASAEYVFVMLLGTLLLLLVEAGGSRLFAIGLVCGAGFWVHQLFAIYVLPLVVILAVRERWWPRMRALDTNTPTRVLLAFAGAYVFLAILAFFTGGVAFEVGRISVSATAPQKMLRIAFAVAALATIAHLARHARGRPILREVRAWSPLAAGLLVGYLPVVLYSILVEPARSPARVADIFDFAAAAPDLLGNIVPIVAGFKMATTERLPVPAMAAVPVLAALAAYAWWSVRHVATLLAGRVPGASVGRDFFPIFFLLVPVLFLASGAYLDTQSYRYLVPWYAGLAVAAVDGAMRLARGRRTHAAVLVAAIVAVHAWQQAAWFRRLGPDTSSRAMLDCLAARGIRGGYADYWTAYKLTFLSKESIVVTPANGVDRYPAYTAFVASLPPGERLDNVETCVSDGSDAGR